ncbi:MAG: hypothetical protein WA432_03445 [Candidatus Babeliaceae bacterium]
MKKILIIIGLFYINFNPSFSKNSEIKVKKVCVIFECKGGAAHICAAQALRTQLEKEYEIIVVNVFDKIIREIDPVRLLTFNQYTGEDFFNFCMMRQ